MLLQIRKCINMPCQNYRVVTGIYVTILHHHFVIFSEIKKIYMLTFIFVLAYMLLRSKKINGLTHQKKNTTRNVSETYMPPMVQNSGLSSL